MRSINSHAALGVLLLALAGQLHGNADVALQDARYLASPVPDRIMLTWDDDPATTQAVTWRTSPQAAHPVAEFALATPGPEFRHQARRLPARETHAMTTGNGAASVHTAAFAGLQPDTLYTYRVGDRELGLWSEWLQFRTAHRDARPFSFIYYGDAQEEVKTHWSRVVRAAFQDLPRPRFILHGGDLVDLRKANGYFLEPATHPLQHDSQWGQWFEASGWINGMVPILATPGNHEYLDGATKLTPHWRAHFALPLNGPKGLEEVVWYLDIQGVRLIALSSTQISLDAEAARVQAQWLDGVLRDNPHRWTIVTHHHPVFNTTGEKEEQTVNLNEIIRPVYERHGVDLVLQGHNHTYARGRNLPAGASRFEESTGTMYVVSVSGPKLGRVVSNWQDRRIEGVQLYQIVSIDGDRLRFRAHTPTGELADAFDLIKGANRRCRLVEVSAN